MVDFFHTMFQPLPDSYRNLHMKNVIVFHHTTFSFSEKQCHKMSYAFWRNSIYQIFLKPVKQSKLRIVYKLVRTSFKSCVHELPTCVQDLKLVRTRCNYLHYSLNGMARLPYKIHHRIYVIGLNNLEINFSDLCFISNFTECFFEINEVYLYF